MRGDGHSTYRHTALAGTLHRPSCLEEVSRLTACLHDSPQRFSLRNEATTSANGMGDTRSASALSAVHTVPGLISHWTKPGQVVTWNMAGQAAVAEGSSITVLVSLHPTPFQVQFTINLWYPPTDAFHSAASRIRKARQ